MKAYEYFKTHNRPPQKAHAKKAVITNMIEFPMTCLWK